MSTVDITVDDIRAAPRRQGSEAGLRRRRPLFYTVHIIANLLILAAGWTASVLLGDSWWQPVAAGYVAAAFAQSGFIDRRTQMAVDTASTYLRSANVMGGSGRSSDPP